jgi:hypothetical protein
MKRIEEIQLTLDVFTLSTVKEIMDQKPLFVRSSSVRTTEEILLFTCFKTGLCLLNFMV